MGELRRIEGVQAMTIKPEALTAMDRMCTPLDPSRLNGVTAYEDARCMELIRAELLAMDAEINRLNHLWEMMTNLAVKKDSQIKDAESRLAAADALLRKCRYEFAGLPHSLGYDFTHLPELDAYLSESAHD
jgi:hypothetical protein